MQILTRHRSRVAAGLAALTVLLLVACEPARPPADTDTPAARGEGSGQIVVNYIVDDVRTGERVSVQEASELQEQLPFSVVVPEYLPTGIHLATITAHVGGPGIRGHSANLYFRSPEGTIGLFLMQMTFEEGMPPPGIGASTVEDIAIGNRMGQINEVDEIAMVWTGCGVSLHLSTVGGEFTREELLQVAESTLTCRGLG